MKILGNTVIKNNEGCNLTLEDGSSHFEIGHNLNMDVHIGYAENPDDAWGYAIPPGPCEDYSDQLTADDSSYFIAYSYLDTEEDTTGRRLRYLKKSEESDEKGHAKKDYEIQTVHSQDVHSYHHDKVYAGGCTEEEGGKGTQYELIRGFAHHTSGGMGSDSDFLYFYSDGFFYEEDGSSNPFVYSDHLATASWGLAQSGAYLGSPDYNYKHAGARKFMADIGCPDQMIYVNDCDVSVPGINTMGVAIGAKNLQKYDGGTLVDTGEVTYTTEDQIIIFRIKLLDSDEVPEGPSKEYTLSFDLNGGTLDEKTGNVIMDVAEGMIISMPKPEREGYEFDYWEGSRYEAGEEYTVKEDHTFIAQWKKNGQDEPSETDVPDDSGSSSGKDGADTSDHNSTLLWGSLMTLALLAAGLNLILRKKSE